VVVSEEGGYWRHSKQETMTGCHYKALVRYTYIFEGQEYTSESVNPYPGKDHTEEDAKESLYRHYLNMGSA